MVCKSGNSMLPVREFAMSKRESWSCHEFADIAVNTFIPRRTQPQTIDGFPTLHASFKHAERAFKRTLIFTIL